MSPKKRGGYSGAYRDKKDRIRPITPRKPSSSKTGVPVRWAQEAIDPKVETGWKKGQKAATRRRHLLDTTDKRLSLENRHEQAARRAQAIENVTKDKETKHLMGLDADYHWKMATKYRGDNPGHGYSERRAVVKDPVTYTGRLKKLERKRAFNDWMSENNYVYEHDGFLDGGRTPYGIMVSPRGARYFVRAFVVSATGDYVVVRSRKSTSYSNPNSVAALINGQVTKGKILGYFHPSYYLTQPREPPKPSPVTRGNLESQYVNAYRRAWNTNEGLDRKKIARMSETELKQGIRSLSDMAELSGR